MSIQQIPRHEWARFLEEFSRQHAGCVCSLEVDSSVAGPELEATSWPFQGIAFETGHGGPHVQIFVGAEPAHHLGHSLSRPTGVWLEKNDEGAHLGLRIEADEGAFRLSFRLPQPLEYEEKFLP